MGGKQLSDESMRTFWVTRPETESTLELDHLLAKIFRNIKAFMNADAGGIYLLDQDEHSLRLEFHSGEDSTLWGGSLRLGEGLPGRVLQTQEPVVASDYGDYPSLKVIAVPLVISTVSIGVLYVSYHAREKHFENADVATLQAFGNQAALVLAVYANLKNIKQALPGRDALIQEARQLPIAERETVIEELSRSIREETQTDNSAEKVEVLENRIRLKLAAIGRLRGLLKSDRTPLSDDEIKEDYVKYLEEKYS